MQHCSIDKEWTISDCCPLTEHNMRCYRNRMCCIQWTILATFLSLSLQSAPQDSAWYPPYRIPSRFTCSRISLVLNLCWLYYYLPTSLMRLRMDYWVSVAWLACQIRRALLQICVCVHPERQLSCDRTGWWCRWLNASGPKGKNLFSGWNSSILVLNSW